MLIPNTSNGPPGYAGAGNALSAVGEVLGGGATPQQRAAGRLLQGIGAMMGAQAQAWEDTLGGDSAPAVLGGVIASVAAAYAIPFGTIASLYPAAAVLLAANPVAAGILAAAFGFVVGAIAWELGKALGDTLFDLLRDILSDPIVLDLNGDGLELIPLAASATLFDLDADGLEERTGWVGAQDGLLVHDTNQNGVVDGIGELFGSAIIDGYDELALLDANNDGRIDSLDPAFADLKVWRDLNSDGVSTADEMVTLAQAGVASFDLAYTQTDTLVSGNVIARTGTYLRHDGTSRAMGSVQFALDERGNMPVIPQDADLGDLLTLPNLPGLEGLPDLRTAMFHDPALRAMVEDLVYGSHEFSTFADFQNGGFLDVLYRWAGVDTSIPLAEGDLPYYMQGLAAFLGRPFSELNPHQVERLEGVWPQLVKHLGTAFLVQAAQLPGFRPFYELSASLASLDPDDPGFSDALAASLQGAVLAAETATPAYSYLDLFAGLVFDPLSGRITGDFNAVVARFLDGQPPFLTSQEASVTAHPWFAWFRDQGSLLFHIGQAMGLGEDYVMNVTGWRWFGSEVVGLYGTLGSDLIDVLDTSDRLVFGNDGNDELRGNSGVDRLVGGAGDDILKGGSASDMYVYASGDGLDRIVEESGVDDAIFFSSELDGEDLQVARVSGTGDLLLHFGSPAAGVVLTGQWVAAESAVEHFYFVAENALSAGDIASLYLATLATEGGDTITGSWASERIIGLGGNDLVSALDGDDRIDGGSGDDGLNGGAGNDIIAGGDDDDLIVAGPGNDVLAGGLGNDRLEGGGGADVYIYYVGDGDDLLFEYTPYDWSAEDTLAFGPGITPGNIVFSKVANDWHAIRISFPGQPGSILIPSQQWSDAGIEIIRFADGTVWNHAQIMSRYIADQVSAGADVIHGSELGDVVESGGGDDLVITDRGHDTLIGGIGNDRLEGGAESDTYVYRPGDGHDVIFDYWAYNWSAIDTLIFGQGITPADILVSHPSRDPGSLRISFKGMSGSVTLLSQSWSDAGLEEIQFADGTVYGEAQLLALLIPATELNDSIAGGAGADILWALEGADDLAGLGGADVLNGQEGADVLNGGDGGDLLYGGAGDDVLIGDDRSSAGPNLIVNGSFEQYGPLVDWGWWGVAASSIPGWTKTGGGNYELVVSGVDWVPVSDGTYWLDMEAGWGPGSNMEISQTVSGLAAGQTLLLRFDLANRTSAGSGGLEVLWNGTVIATLTDPSFAMVAKSYSVTAVDGDNFLTFRGIGSEDRTGASLDNVRLQSLLEPSPGIDQLDGGDGDDILDGGALADILTGGAGADVFRFREGDTGVGLASDRITDFAAGVDRIDLSAIDADTGASGDQGFAFIGSAAFSGAAGQLRFESQGADTIIQADTDGDGMANFQIVLTGTVTLSVADFIA